VEFRVVIHAPTGKDARLIAQVLLKGAMAHHICTHATDIISELAKGAGALLIAEEALDSGLLRAVSGYLGQQQAWSDLPVLVLGSTGLEALGTRSLYPGLGNVTLLERPVQSVTLVSAATSALRARRRQYEMRDVDRRKDEFLAMLAHELRNPLAPVSAAADLLRIAKLDVSVIRQTSEIISRQVKHMTALIDDLLDMSRVSRGLVTVDRCTLEIRDIMTNAVEQARPLIDTRRHTLTVHMAEDAAFVIGDQKRLVQVLTNLLNNAAKYTPEGGHIVLSSEVKWNTVVFSITDNGIGMLDGDIERVFDMFAQAERTPDRSQGGLGIGLALVKSLVELHHGTVSAVSQGLGSGSTFIVTLPRLVQLPADRPQLATTVATPIDHRCVLIVDDNVDAAAMLAMLLESMGFRVLVEHTADAALQRAREEVPDVCLLDLGLPGMDGIELAVRLRSEPATAASLLIAITGYGQEQDRKRTAKAGFDSHLVKPVRMDEVLRLLAMPKRRDG
jgi:signal transduction histidine kinase/ActR/RegA family two-component response regulator